jgi:hypothetical protein
VDVLEHHQHRPLLRQQRERRSSAANVISFLRCGGRSGSGYRSAAAGIDSSARPVQACRNVILSKRAGGTPSRPQSLAVTWLPMRVPAPQRADAAAPLDLWCVRAWNAQVEWILLSTGRRPHRRAARTRLTRPPGA